MWGEVWQVVKAMKGEKVMCLNGYSGAFFQVSWDVVKDDVMKVFWDSHCLGKEIQHGRKKDLWTIYLHHQRYSQKHPMEKPKQEDKVYILSWIDKLHTVRYKEQKSPHLQKVETPAKEFL